jgi:hypothetical protein
MDEFMAHQTPDTFDHVFTSDRNFYDRFYFNMHPSSDELFLITGMGQYPNLGTMDAFVSVGHGDHHHVVRASRELGSNRMDTTVGPFGVEVVEGLRKIRVWCEPNEWGLAFDLTFDGTVPALEEPPTFQRQDWGRVTMNTSRYSQVGTWSGTLEVGGRTFDVTPDRWRGVRDHSWGVRGVGEPEAPGIRIKTAMQGFGFYHVWAPIQLEDGTLLKLFVEEDMDGNRTVEESAKVHPIASGGAIEPMGRPEFQLHYQSGTREIEAATIRVDDPDGKPLTIAVKPLRTVYLAAGSGYIPKPDWGHGMYQGPLEVQGLTFDMSSPEARRENGPLHETLSRYELSTGEVGYGLFENLVVGTYHPDGFADAGAVAP